MPHHRHPAPLSPGKSAPDRLAAEAVKHRSRRIGYGEACTALFGFCLGLKPGRRTPDAAQRPGEVPVSIRLDPEVLDYFKEASRGYQSRINAVLLGYVRSQQQRRGGRR